MSKNIVDIRSLLEIAELAKEYDIPVEDTLFLDLNRKGVVIEGIDFERIRCLFRFSGDNPFFHESREHGIDNFFLAMPTHSGISNYRVKDDDLYLEDELVGRVFKVENDTCDSVYPRRNGTVFNLNAIAKSKCRGCVFCHTFKQVARDMTELSLADFIDKHIREWLNKCGKPDMSYLYRVDMVSGCLGSEERLLDLLRLIRKIFERYNYKGELFYFGSELTSEKAFDAVLELSPFGLCFSLECFGNREVMLRSHKAKVSLDRAKEILDIAKSRGFGSQFSYVLGLESLDFMLEKMQEFSPYVNRIPVVNIFQPHTAKQRDLLIPEARRLRYFLDARKGLEGLFAPKRYRPRTWGNYRGLWYLKFQDEYLTDFRLP